MEDGKWKMERGLRLVMLNEVKHLCFASIFDQYQRSFRS